MKIWLGEVIIAEVVTFCVAGGKIIKAVSFLGMSAKNIFLINQQKNGRISPIITCKLIQEKLHELKCYYLSSNERNAPSLM